MIKLVRQELPLLMLLAGLALIFFTSGRPLTALGMILIVAGGALAARGRGK